MIDTGGQNALHFCASCGKAYSQMKVLIDFTNININLRNIYGDSPLYVVKKEKSHPYWKEYKRILEDKGAESVGTDNNYYD